MELIKPGINIDFVSKRRMWMIISAVLTLVSILILVFRGGPNYGIDFTGGVMMHLRFKEAKAASDVRTVLTSIDLGVSDIQDFGAGGTEFILRMPLEASEVTNASEKVSGALREKFGGDAFEVLRVEVVGPRVGAELRERAFLAVVFSTLMMGIYIWFRFEWRFAIGAAVALAHDVILALGALALFNYEFDLSTVAALLTIVGFSVNDTVIVSDRIRENMRKNRRESLATIINRSINETLSRTVLTTGTAIMVILSLFFLGGNVIHSFAFTLLVGFIVGTYSTVYIASPMVLAFEGMSGKRPRK
jgi:preprotein translocase subunit SecF